MRHDDRMHNSRVVYSVPPAELLSWTLCKPNDSSANSLTLKQMDTSSPVPLAPGMATAGVELG